MDSAMRIIRQSPLSSSPWPLLSLNHLRPDVSVRDTLVKLSIGSFLAAGSDVVADVMTGAGFDWLLVDLEHGAGGEEGLARQIPVIKGAGLPCFVRVESQERIRLGHALDLGADGVMVPRVETRTIDEA